MAFGRLGGRFAVTSYHLTGSLRIVPSEGLTLPGSAAWYWMQSMVSGVVPVLRTARLPAGATRTTEQLAPSAGKNASAGHAEAMAGEKFTDSGCTIIWNAGFFAKRVP